MLCYKAYIGEVVCLELLLNELIDLKVAGTLFSAVVYWLVDFRTKFVITFLRHGPLASTL